jgi:hypothetical protein
MSAKYMLLYIAEFQFRYNNRENRDIFGTANYRMLMRDWACAAGFVAILVVFLGGTLLWAFSDFLIALPECYSSETNQTENTKSQEDAPATSSSLSHLIPSDQAQNKTAKPSPDKYYECIVAEYTRRLAAFTKWLAIATIFLVICTGGLVVFARNQLRDSRAVQRAYVFVLAPQSQLLLDNNGLVIGLRLWIVWKNSGVTPASPINALIGAAWVPSIDQFTFGEVSQDEIRQPFVLGPGAEVASGTIDVSAAHLLATFNGQGFQFLSGWARYRDIFPNSREHVVEFCFRVIIEGQLGPPPFSGRVSFVFYGEHNRHYDA